MTSNAHPGNPLSLILSVLRNPLIKSGAPVRSSATTIARTLRGVRPGGCAGRKSNNLRHLYVGIEPENAGRTQPSEFS